MTAPSIIHHDAVFSDLTEVELLEEIVRVLGDDSRQSRQVDEFGTEDGNFESCSLVGFEFRRGEECNEVKEIECYPVNVTKKRFGKLSYNCDKTQS